MTPSADSFEEILLLKDNTKGAERDRRSGATRWDAKAPITIRLHRINGTGTTVEAEKSYRPGSNESNHRSRVKAVAQLLCDAAIRGSSAESDGTQCRNGGRLPRVERCTGWTQQCAESGLAPGAGANDDAAMDRHGEE